MYCSADVLSGTVNEPMEPGGAGEERSGQLHHPFTADHQEDPRGERSRRKAVLIIDE